jgi:hypothetical protein
MSLSPMMGSVAALQRNVERLDGFARPQGKQIAHGLEVKHQSLKTLQKRIMEFAGDARPLTYALFEAHIELDSKLVQVVAMDAPHQKEN